MIGVVSTFVNGESWGVVKGFLSSLVRENTIWFFGRVLLGLGMTLCVVVCSRVRCLRACGPCECHSSGIVCMVAALRVPRA